MAEMKRYFAWHPKYVGGRWIWLTHYKWRKQEIGRKAWVEHFELADGYTAQKYCVFSDFIDPMDGCGGFYSYEWVVSESTP